MRVQISLWDPAFISSGYTPRTGIPGSYDSSISNFFRHLQYCFPQWLYQLTFLPTVHNGSLRQHLSLVFLMIAILTVRWYFTVGLICVFLMISDVEHIFMYLLVICMSFLEKCLFTSSVFCCYWYWILWVLYIFWISDPYQIYDLQIFSLYGFRSYV